MVNELVLTPKAETHRDQFEWGELTWFAGNLVGNSDDITVGQCVLRPGQSNHKHYHPNCSEIMVLYQGRLTCEDTAGNVLAMNEGDTLSIPRGYPLQITNIGDVDAIGFLAYSSAERQTAGA